MTLTEFLLARIAEDEAVARACAERFEPEAGGPIYLEDPWPSEAAFVTRFTATRILAECEAKRAIVDLAVHAIGYGSKRVLLALAAIYADHPDYDESWRP